ncbi:MAG: hypothetical protein DMF62_15535 [Acidobacteria bacterium]|nr:MAG: hypothetical protein DMF62_15535 [Acidobacteriota bacterium]
MNCPVCKRELAPTLSICLTCGAMMHDTVREELESKIVKPPSGPLKRPEKTAFEPVLPWTPQPIKVAAKTTPTVPEVIPINSEESVKHLPVESLPVATKPRPITAQLSRKETNPTLVDFMPANPTVPDWRLKLQNSIRKRNGVPIQDNSPQVAAAPLVTSAPVIAQRVSGQLSEPPRQNEKLANAMKRIEASRKVYGSGAAVGMAAAATAKAKKSPPPIRSFPFDVVERTQAASANSMPAKPIVEAPKPKLVSPLRIEKKKFDTNKLPPIPEPETPLPAAIVNDSLKIEVETELKTKLSFDRLSFWNAKELFDFEEVEHNPIEDIDDLAPFSMRFGAAVFDLIIGGFASAILLSPLLVTGTSFATTSGVFAILGAAIAVMFVYFTATIAIVGRTFGMKLFAIEIIDAEANELPSLHQAAVNSAVYILSLMLLGIGFVPLFFNEERRAMHDIVAGTLLIREY